MLEIIIIKLGRALSLFQQEGLIKGFLLAINISYKNFKKIFILTKGEVLFIGDGIGDSTRYRTDHVAEELNKHGISSAVTIQGNPFLLSLVDKFSIFVIHRVIETDMLKQFVNKIKKQNKIIIFETDDFVFDEKFFKYIEHFKAHYVVMLIFLKNIINK